LAEKFIFGYFQTMDAAQKAAQELNRLGFETDVDRFSPIGGGDVHDRNDQDLTNPFQDQTLSLAESTLGSPRMSDDKRILLAAHPDASGLSGGQPMDSLEDVCLTVFTSPERYDEALAVLHKHGARK